MLESDRTDASEGTDIHKLNTSRVIFIFAMVVMI